MCVCVYEVPFHFKSEGGCENKAFNSFPRKLLQI